MKTKYTQLIALMSARNKLRQKESLAEIDAVLSDNWKKYKRLKKARKRIEKKIFELLENNLK